MMSARRDHPRHLREIDGERLDPWRIGAIAHSSVEHVDLGWRQRDLGWLLGCGTRDHRRPEAVPSNDREDGEELGQALGGAQAGGLSTAARLQHLMEQLDFPAACIPAQLLDRLLDRGDGQVGGQFEVAPGWWTPTMLLREVSL